MSIEFNHKLGKTIGIYGDSFAVHPYKYKDKRLRQRLLIQLTSDINQLRPNYLPDQSLLAEPKHNTQSDIVWWTYQMRMMVDNMVHSGYSGTSVGDMLFHQIDVDDRFVYLDNSDKFSHSIVPDIMICCWTDPFRIYLDLIDLYQNKTMSIDDMHRFNELHLDISAPGEDIFNKEKIQARNHQKDLGFLLRNRTMFTHIQSYYQLQSGYATIQQRASWKIMFDQHWYYKLKQKNSNVKIIHIDCFSDNDVNQLDKTLPLNNCVWIQNFALHDLNWSTGLKEQQLTKKDQIGNASRDWRYFIGHFGLQKQHDFVAKTLTNIIKNYDQYRGKFDFSDWKSQYDML